MHVVPVVEDERQDVDVTAPRNRREEVPRDDVAAGGKPGLREARARPRRRLRSFEDHAAQMPVRLQYLRQEHPLAPPMSTTVLTLEKSATARRACDRNAAPVFIDASNRA